MGRPQRHEELVSCPACGSYDNVALLQGDNAILWCSCGIVYRLWITEGCMVTEYEQICDFDKA